MGKALWNLFVALINATLILVAICLFLGWKVLGKVDDLSNGFTQTIAAAAPVSGQLQSLRGDIADIREDLRAARTDAANGNTAALDAVLTRIISLETRAETVIEQAETLSADPSVVIDQAIETTLGTMTGNIQTLIGCVPDPEQTSLLLLPARSAG